MSLVRLKVDALFRELLSCPSGEVCENPVTGGRFVRGERGEDSISYQKRAAETALLAQEWFAVYGPRNAPLLPLSQAEWDTMRYCSAGGMQTLVGSFARSLGFQEWKVHGHLPFEDFARGLMVFPNIRERVGRDPLVAKRYPPLVGMWPHETFWESAIADCRTSAEQAA